MDIPNKWQEENGRLVREFGFKNFVEAMEFANKLVPIAEKTEYHPDIHISYNKVVLELVTHEENKITEKDISLAEEINNLL